MAVNGMFKKGQVVQPFFANIMNSPSDFQLVACSRVSKF